ncbi:MAG: ABC transporter permease [Planctomycetota bacterium]|nr:ABC transporter permease [Planctomycetota bacterium]
MLSRIMVIARREFLAAVANKAFLISLLVMPLIMGLGAWLPGAAGNLKSQRERTVAIIDRTPGASTRARETLEAVQSNNREEGVADPLDLIRVEDGATAADDQAQLAIKYELAEKVRLGDLAAFFEIGRDALDEKANDSDIVTYYSGAAFDKDMMTAVAARLAAIVQLQKSGPANPLLWTRANRRYTPVELARMLRAGSKGQTRWLVQRDLPQRDAAGAIVDGNRVESSLRALVPIFAVLLLFLVVMVGAMPQLHGVLEEKTNRIGEVLLGSASPFEILTGKLLGMSLTGLLLSSIYLGGALFMGARYGLLGDMRADLPLWFLLFQVLALLMFGSMFIAVGSACSDMKQAQTMVTPVTLAASVPMMFMLPVIEDPTGAVARTLSLIPPATPMLMLARLAAAPRLPWWEPVLGTILVLISVAVALWVAARIFRNGYLRQGQAPSFRTMLSWLKQDD